MAYYEAKINMDILPDCLNTDAKEVVQLDQKEGIEANLTVLLEPTSSCNLNCIYCYKGNKTNKKMSFEVLEKILREVIFYNEKRNIGTSFLWHGGEPTLVGEKFFNNAIKYIDTLHCRKKVSHTIQTNGTLLSEELLDLFANHKFSIGVSLDGPAEYHNRMRAFKDGGPTYEIIYDGILRAKAKGIEVGVLMSITNDNIQYVKDIFEFCRRNRLTMGLNPITADLHSPHVGIEVTPKNYLRACIEAFDLWFYQKDFSIQVNPGFGVTRLLLSKARLSDCFMSENCQAHFISIGPEGDIYPCNRFYGILEYRLGNILADNFNDILNCPKRRFFQSRAADQINGCKSCSISKYCNGGCIHHAIAHNGLPNTPDHLCLVYRGLIDHAINRLSEQLH